MSTEPLIPPRTRLSRTEWADAALDALATGGPHAVAVEPLARKLGVTKGSFYWHFRARGELLEAALQRWQSLNDEALAAAVGSDEDPRRQLEAHVSAALGFGRYGTLLAFLAVAREEPVVRQALLHATAQQLDAIRDALLVYGFSAEEATRRAAMCYRACVGQLVVGEHADLEKNRWEFVQDVVDTLLLPQAA